MAKTELEIIAKNKAIEIAGDINATNQDTVIINVKYIASTVVDALQSVIGSQKHMWTENEAQQINLWIEVEKQANNIYK